MLLKATIATITTGIAYLLSEGDSKKDLSVNLEEDEDELEENKTVLKAVLYYAKTVTCLTSVIAVAAFIQGRRLFEDTIDYL